MGIINAVAVIAARQIPPLTPGTPTLAPPSRVTTDFTSPSALADRILQVNVACVVLAVIFLTLRLFTRIRITRSVVIDGYTAIIALMFIFGFRRLALECRAVGMGRHLWVVEASAFYRGRFFMASVDTIAEAFYYAAISASRRQSCSLHLRIFITGQKMKIFIYVFIAILVIYNALGALLNLLTRGNEVDAYWRVNIDFSHTCLDIYHIHFSMRCFNRFAIVGVFLTGLLYVFASSRHLCLIETDLRRRAVVASIVTLYHTISQGNYVPDITSYFSEVILCLAPAPPNTIELYIAFFCSCMPAFKQLIQRIVPMVKSSFVFRRGGRSDEKTKKPKTDIDTRLTDASNLELGNSREKAQAGAS
ncbi:MAG: hypothetical protein M1838_005394, partial [Thelocarpon superellum]